MSTTLIVKIITLSHNHVNANLKKAIILRTAHPPSACPLSAGKEAFVLSVKRFTNLKMLNRVLTNTTPYAIICT